MAINQIPKRIHNGFVKLTNLSEEEFDVLTKILQRTPISLGIGELVKNAKIADEKLLQNTEDILISIGNLSSIGEREILSSSDLADEIINLISKGEIKELQSSSKDKLEILKRRITELLKIESVYYSAKAVQILMEHEHVFGSVRILTDCRPVFGKDVDNDLKASVIINMLQIHYHENGEHKEVYFALDEKDLLQLKRVIERAENKVKKIKTAFLNPNVKILG
jgi:hypothetical protein